MFNFFGKNDKRDSAKDKSVKADSTKPEEPEDLVASRFEPLLGGEFSVFHEIVSDELHIDVYCWKPTKQRPVWTLVTSGMREYKMQMPERMAAYDRTELVMTLPGDWPLDQIGVLPGGGGDEITWPLELIKFLARLPKDMNSWLGYGTSIQAGPSLDDTYPGSEFSGVIIGGAVSVDKEGNLLETRFGDDTVHFLGVFPVYQAEMEAYIAPGGEHILGDIYEAGIMEGAYPGRPSVV